MITRTMAALVSTALLAGCGGPRPAEQQGDVCRSIATEGRAPYPWPDILQSATPLRAVRQGDADLLVRPENRGFRDKVSRRYAVPTAKPLEVLSVSAGGAWGAFSIGFLDGWGHNAGPDPRPRFDIVTGVSTGSMIAPIIFLNDQGDIERLRGTYRTLTNDQVFTKRSLLTALASTSLYDTAPLRRRVESLLDTGMVLRIARENEKNRMLALLVVNLDSGVPEVFDITEMASDATKTLEERRRRIIDVMMASAAIPIAFPPVFIDGNMYVDGGARRHAFIAREVMAAVQGQPREPRTSGLERYSLSAAHRPIDLAIVVSGDMRVMRDCVGKKRLDLLAMAGRTQEVVTDQLLRDSVELLLLQVGQSRANRARFVDASALVAYPKSRDADLRSGLCAVPEGDDALFDPTFQDCLDRQGYAVGQRDLIPWKIQLRESRMVRSPRS
ncbi:hypothetical protein FHP25_29860 [Vineibacter terrae]|uniref:PNPLA domain-containing protein n=1 Tax=Vineibacter terrae TaxID=2586908 RepID=A0A5C8PDG9_9HYPH|nr:patatin-like phospholipase family protein [Vineibacter terrae]TXL71438.1 hypothetical protein FHP25_29860 [Vineibacter terrae]